MLRITAVALLLLISAVAWAGAGPGPSRYLKTSGHIEKVDERARKIYIRQDSRLLVFSADHRLCSTYRQKANRKVTAYYLKSASGELVLKNLKM